MVIFSLGCLLLTLQPHGSARLRTGHCFHLWQGLFVPIPYDPKGKHRELSSSSKAREGLLVLRAHGDWSCFTILVLFQHSIDFQQCKRLLDQQAVSLDLEQTSDKSLSEQSACHPAPLSKFQQGAGTLFCCYSWWDTRSQAFAQCSLAVAIVALILSATSSFLSFQRAPISLSGFVLCFF